MTYTEEEAKTKWCPQVQVSISPTSYSRTNMPNQESKTCIASGCMAFRWVDDHEIELTNGHIVIVDQADTDWCNTLGLWWDGHYARGESGRLHVLIYERHFGEVPDGKFIDHADGDSHNCRRGNLRAATPSENAANSASRGGSSKYRGVHEKNNGRWAAQISKDGVRESLGTYDTERQAAGVYDDAATRIHGKFARLNLTPRVNSGRRGYCGLAGKP